MRKLADPKECTKRGVSSWCRACTNAVSRANQKAAPSIANAASRKSKLKVYYGMSLEDYNRMLRQQDGGCAICKTDIPGGKGRFAVDHCHETGLIRGLLCNRCNIGLGHFRDDITHLEKAIIYLQAGG